MSINYIHWSKNLQLRCFYNGIPLLPLGWKTFSPTYVFMHTTSNNWDSIGDAFSFQPIMLLEVHMCKSAGRLTLRVSFNGLVWSTIYMNTFQSSSFPSTVPICLQTAHRSSSFLQHITPKYVKRLVGTSPDVSVHSKQFFQFVSINWLMI